MANLRNNIYLHFLDRELRSSVKCETSNDRIMAAVFTATCLSRGQIFCAYSHLWESTQLLREIMPQLETMSQADILTPASDYTTSDEFLYSRKRLYLHDKERYPFYFHNEDRAIVTIEPSFQTSIGATAFLEEFLGFDIPKELFGNASNRSEELHAIIRKGLIERDGRAITSSLFKDLSAENVTFLPIIRRIISYGYASHYMTQCRADIITGFSGLAAYDLLSHSFPHYDLRLLLRFLTLVGLLKPERSTWIHLLSSTIRDHGTPSHTYFLEEWEQLTFELMHNCALGQREPAIGEMTAELTRRCSKVITTVDEMLRFDQLGQIVHSIRKHSDHLIINSATRQAADRSANIVLLIVATDREWEAVKNIGGQYGLKMNPLDLHDLAAWDLGVLNGTHFKLVRSEMGTQGANAATLVTYDALKEISPKFALMPGIAFGLQQGKQKLADILIADRITDYETIKVTSDHIFERGGTYPASTGLLSKARTIAAAASDMHFGEIISGSKLVNDPSFISELLNRFPEAIGGDMEGIGLAAACHRARVDWLLVKGICDWGYDKDDKHQRTAAERAVDFCFKVSQ